MTPKICRQMGRIHLTWYLEYAGCIISFHIINRYIYKYIHTQPKKCLGKTLAKIAFSFGSIAPQVPFMKQLHLRYGSRELKLN